MPKHQSSNDQHQPRKVAHRRPLWLGASTAAVVACAALGASWWLGLGQHRHQDEAAAYGADLRHHENHHHHGDSDSVWRQKGGAPVLIEGVASDGAAHALVTFLAPGTDVSFSAYATAGVQAESPWPQVEQRAFDRGDTIEVAIPYAWQVLPDQEETQGAIPVGSADVVLQVQGMFAGRYTARVASFRVTRESQVRGFGLTTTGSTSRHKATGAGPGGGKGTVRHLGGQRVHVVPSSR